MAVVACSAKTRSPDSRGRKRIDDPLGLLKMRAFVWELMVEGDMDWGQGRPTLATLTPAAWGQVRSCVVSVGFLKSGFR